MANNDAATQAFIQKLAGITDDAERARLLASVKMQAMQAAPEEAFEPPIASLGEYLERPITIPPVLVHPTFLVRGGVNATVARAGKGKTVMNLNRIMRWAAGLPMFDGWKDQERNEDFLTPDKPLRTLIVENEGAAGMFHRQVGIMLNAPDKFDDNEKAMVRDNVMIWGDGGYSSLKLDDATKLQGLRLGIEKHKPDLVFIEPFRSLWAGEENSSTEMSNVAEALQDIAADFDCGVILSHHERKSGAGEDGEKMSAGRGSTVLEGFVTVMENFESVKAGDQRELSWSKVRYQDPDRLFPAPVRMEWIPKEWWYKWIPADAIGDSALTVLRDNPDDPLSIADLADALDETKQKMRQVMEKLRKDGRVKKVAATSDGSGSTGFRYRLPSSDSGGLAI